eukprot:TRINITY_DN2068_c0_g1_i2.p1 TRINITY_DN2068_c0_g1~~TRINITY_DN2068_c0_g1_i2.p1  ORF type:complete len:274 (+),score=46.02 TRINITY_DN2068_c0_g1_i2:834-1655(+)
MGLSADFLKLPFDWLYYSDFDQRPAASLQMMFICSAGYLILISVLSFLMRLRGSPLPQFILKPLSMIHNFVMCAYSAYAMVGTTIVLYNNWKSAGFDPLVPICDPDRIMKVDMDYWMYTFYLSKFWEYIDTVLLIFRNKPVFPPSNPQYFLHVFHHSVTASIVWFAWRVPFSAAWIGPFTNSFVHTLMYGYYLLTDLGMDRRWGGVLITPVQILQFIVCMMSVMYDTFNLQKCKADGYAIAWMLFTYSVFLYFFVVLLFEKKAQRKESDKKKQ